jgi:3-oxoacyl-[acyl-carrier protein] reductase
LSSAHDNVVKPSVAVITGASQGIGAAIARHFAGVGYAVVVNYHKSPEAAEALCADITEAGGSAKAFHADITDEAQSAALIDFAVTGFGGLSVLVNNAGFAEGMPISEITAAHIDATFALNIRGLLFCCKHAARAFGENGGAIINISSVNGISPVPGGAAYSGSKAAVNAITIALARELGPKNIRVNALAPGLTMTKRYLADIPESAKQHVIGETPLGRLGTPDDIARAAAFLAAADAGWVTGQILAASGGAT